MEFFSRYRGTCSIRNGITIKRLPPVWKPRTFVSARSHAIDDCFRLDDHGLRLVLRVVIGEPNRASDSSRLIFYQVRNHGSFNDRNIVAEQVLGLPREPNVERGLTWAEARKLAV